MNQNLSNKPSCSWIEAVIYEPMFSGKTEELVHRLKLAQIDKQSFKVFKLKIKTRHNNNVVSHYSLKLESMSIKLFSELFHYTDDIQMVNKNEVQYSCNSIVKIAGSDMTLLGNPFGPISKLMTIAKYTDKVHVVCTRTDNIESYWHITITNDETILIGEKQIYKPLSRDMFWETIHQQYIRNQKK